MAENLEKAERDAVEFASRAVCFDQQGNFDAAIYYYRAAAQALCSALLLGSVVAGLKDKSDEYIRRAEVLMKEKQKQVVKVQKNEQQLMLERAEFHLRHALDEDEAGNYEEAVELYSQAVEICLKAMKLTTDQSLKSKLTKLAKDALDRAESLKQKMSSTSSQPVVSSSCSGEVHNASDPKVSKETAKSQLVKDSDVSKSQVKPQLHVSGSDSYTKEEINVLRISSVINGREYVPFMLCDLKERFAYPLPYDDKDGKLTLSPKQKSLFRKWARLEDIATNPKVIELIDCFSIRQTVVSDCSFVASLAVSALYEKRFKKRVITSIIYPQNRAGDPVYNPCGKYMVKFNINGIHRKVIIDDYLPLGSHGELLCSYSSNKNEFWISLLEKAYMKVMGGYDFPGSNSNIDLHALTSWIPERISIEDPNFNKDHIFKMLLTHHRKGDVLLTVSTGELNDVEAERAGLVKSHAYALLDIQEVLGQRLFLLKNPWSHLRWKGKFSEHDTAHWTPQLREALKYDPRNAQMFDNGVFWIDYSSLCHFFSVIYLNWNPQLFKYTYCVHQSWKAGCGPAKDQYNIGENPQFSLELKGTSGTVWVLLTRHITERTRTIPSSNVSNKGVSANWACTVRKLHNQNSETDAEVQGHQEDDIKGHEPKYLVQDDFADNKEYIAVLVYKNNGRRVYFPYDPEPYIDGVRINSPHYLCKILVPEGGSTRYTLVVSQYEKTTTIFYTLRAYSTCPFRLVKIPNYFKYKQEVRNGEWTDGTAGGCHNHPLTYHKNPVYQLTLQSSSDDNHLVVDLKGPKQYNVGFEIVTVTVNNNQSPGYFRERSTEVYRSGFNVLELSDVPSGTYNIIPSTFLPNQKSPFFLTVQASCPISVKRLK